MKITPSDNACGDSADRTRILIVDADTARQQFVNNLLSGIQDLEVSATAANGRIALAKLRQVPVDLVLLDFDMPGVNGLETLERIQRDHPQVGVIAVSGKFTEEADAVVRALQMGVLDFLPKVLDLADDNGIRDFRLRLLTLVGLFRSRKNTQRTKRLAQGRGTVARKPASPATKGKPADERPDPKGSPPKRARLPLRIEGVAIGVSTGGPNALMEVIPRLPQDMGAPVFVVQHMPSQLTASLAASLDQKSALTVREAVEGEPVFPNTVYVAPGGRHMVIRQDKALPLPRRYIQLNTEAPVNSCRPSVDVLFQSLAAAYGGNILAVIMTGMGSDGVRGLKLLKEKGCYSLSQTEETCVVYGMPRSVDEAGLSDERVPLDRLSERIVELVGRAERKIPL